MMPLPLDPPISMTVKETIPALSPSKPPSRARRSVKPTTPRSSNGSTSTAKPRSSVGPSEPRRSKPTFTTVRSYPEVAPEPLFQPHVDEGELQRSHRKSKVDAINKLDRVGTPTASSVTGPTATSFIPPPPLPAGPSILRNPLKRPPIQNPPFDINTVRTEAPRYPSPRESPRMFGLEEAPTFYPTAEEFVDPMEYITSIGPQGRPYGIAKIVPPEGWRMPFSLPTENFRFKTRLQRLNSLEAASRAKVNFLEQLSMFHKQQGNADATIPIIERKTVDLWRLRKEVNKVGGVLTLNRTNGWDEITAAMGFAKYCTPHIKKAYMEIVHPFDEWSVRAKASLSQSPLHPYGDSSAQRPPNFKSEPGSPTKAGRMSGMRSMPARTNTNNLAPPIALQPTSTSVKLPTSASLPARLDHATNGPATPAPGSRVRVPGFSSAGGTESDLSSEASSPGQPSPPPLPQYVKGDVCEICRHGHAASKILLCDGCDRGFHTYCLDPPLTQVPTNEEWFCTACVFSQGEDFGFEEGDEHSIPSFQARDSSFAWHWWNKHRPGPSTNQPPNDKLHRMFGRVPVTEDDVEREFWRLTESQTETVEIEYGADVHSTTHGSAAPTKELHPLNPYSDDPWNLNNMPIVKESLLRYIKSDISGMTVPWIYLGMLFSAFCWHNEDHYTYSVNYMHWGETKTWYGVPGSDAEKFEAAIKAEAPELFEQQPALLYQLVTMMNPGRLQELGTKVVACNQRPNEFVITWPKAYHCGFNHGINFNEAVNFALPDWLRQGKDCVMRYKQHAKAPVFSHNELLITITLFSDTIKTALWLQDSLAIMVEEETGRRDRLRAEVPMLTETLVEEDCPEEQYQCCICKGFCYLSQVTCSCTKLVTCIDHANQLCSCGKSKRSLRKRYSENQLEEILAAVQLRASQPGNWRSRFDNLLEVARPPLKSMKALLAEGERISYPIPEVEDLRALVTRANSWVDKVSALAQRKSASRRKKGRQEESEEFDRSPASLMSLLSEVDRLAFDSPEIIQLRQVLHDIESFKQQAESILSAPEDELDLLQCQTALILGNSLNIEMTEIASLSTVVKRLLWFKKVDEDVDDRTLSYTDVLDLIAEAEECEVPSDHPTMVELRSRSDKGEAWRNAVEALFAQPEITVEELTGLIEDQEMVPTDIDTMRQLESMRKTAQTWQTSVSTMLTGNGTIAGASRLVKAIKSATGPTGKLHIPDFADLQAEIDFHTEWCTRLSTYIGCKKEQLGKELTEFLKMVDNGLDPEDDDIKEDWATCFCRGPPQTIMVTCEECAGTYHPKCVSIHPKQADKPFTCEMCLQAFVPGRPSVNTLARFADRHKWNFILPPPELVTVDRIVGSFVRYATVVLDLADPADHVETCRDAKLLAHHMRKLFNIPLYFDAQDTESNTTIVFEDWLRRRWRDAKDFAAGIHHRTINSSHGNNASGGAGSARKPPAGSGEVKYTRSRKPKFILKESHEGEFACICTTPPVDHLLVVTCHRCKQGYHASCVYCPMEMMAEEVKWKCPCCTVRAGQHYVRSVELRVQRTADLGTTKYVDYRGTLKYFAEEPIIVELPPPPPTNLGTLVLECTEFVEPYIPEDQERDEAGQPKKKTKLSEHAGAGSAGCRTPLDVKHEAMDLDFPSPAQPPARAQGAGPMMPQHPPNANMSMTNGNGNGTPTPMTATQASAQSMFSRPPFAPPHTLPPRPSSHSLPSRPSSHGLSSRPPSHGLPPRPISFAAPMPQAPFGMGTSLTGHVQRPTPPPSYHTPIPAPAPAHAPVVNSNPFLSGVQHWNTARSPVYSTPPSASTPVTAPAPAPLPSAIKASEFPTPPNSNPSFHSEVDKPQTPNSHLPSPHQSQSQPQPQPHTQPAPAPAPTNTMASMLEAERQRERQRELERQKEKNRQMQEDMRNQAAKIVDAIYPRREEEKA